VKKDEVSHKNTTFSKYYLLQKKRKQKEQVGWSTFTGEKIDKKHYSK
jgi:hypothetical protein